MASKPGRKPSGSGTIYRRKDGRYETAVWVTTPKGQRRRRRVYGRTYEETHEKYIALKRQADQGNRITTRSQRVDEYLRYWLDQVAKPTVRGTTHAKYETFIRLYLAPGLGRKRLDKLTTADVRAFLNAQREQGVSTHRLQAMHAILRNALQNAVREDLVARNVAALVRVPQAGSREFRPWSVDEAVTFLDEARGHPLHAAFVLVIALGLRRGEVLGVAWDQVDLDEGTVRVRQQLQRVGGQLRLTEVKTRRSGRMVPLPDLCIRALRKRRAEQAAERLAAGKRWQESGLVFTTRHGTPIEPRNLARTFDVICAHAEVRRIRLHDTRHTCASLLAAAGTHPRTIMAILGHSQIGVTMNVYTHVTTEDQRAAVGLVGGLLDRAPAGEEVPRSRQTWPSDGPVTGTETDQKDESAGQEGGPTWT
jgi:integrase